MAQMKKILVAYDGSPHSKQALNWAIELSLLSGAQVTAVKVCDSIRLYPAMSDIEGRRLQKVLDELRREDQKLIEEVATLGKSRGVEVKGEILQGNIAGEIIGYAKKHNFDIIAVGTKGHGALEDLLMGSVTRNLVSLAHIPVFVFKD